MKPRLSAHPVYQPLKRAVMKNDSEAIESLLSSVVDATMLPALVHRAARWAFDAQSLEAFGLVMESRWGFEPLAEVGLEGKSLLLYMLNQSGEGSKAAKAFPDFLGVLVNAGIPLDHPEYHPHVPLSHVAAKNEVTLMRALLDAGADPDGNYRYLRPDGTSGHEWPPLLKVQTVPGVRLLLERGASPGAAAPLMPDALSGGLCYVLHKWKNEQELPALIDAFLANGGTWLTPMEMAWAAPIPLAVTVMMREVGHAWSSRYTAVPELWTSFFQEENALQERRHLLQELFVGRGLDLQQPSPYRFPWAEFVKESGSPRLKRQLALGAELPEPAPRVSKAPRF